MGIGFAMRAKIDYFKFITIAESWIVCPLLVMALAFVLCHLLLFIFKNIRISTLLVQNALGVRHASVFHHGNSGIYIFSHR